MGNYSWQAWKWKIIFPIDASMRFQKAEMEEGIRPIKPLQTGWGRETFQTQYPIWNYLWLPWKWKIICAMNTNMKCKIAEMEEGIMLLKSLWASWKRENIICNQNTLFGGAHSYNEKETIFWIVKKVNRMKIKVRIEEGTVPKE